MALVEGIEPSALELQCSFQLSYAGVTVEADYPRPGRDADPLSSLSVNSSSPARHASSSLNRRVMNESCADIGIPSTALMKYCAAGSSRGKGACCRPCLLQKTLNATQQVGGFLQ
jgi:hypothetical protein